MNFAPKDLITPGRLAIVLTLWLVAVLSVAAGAGEQDKAAAGEAAAGEAAEPAAGDDDDSAADDAGEAQDPLNPALPPPIWKSGLVEIPAPQGPVGPALFPERLGPIPLQQPPAPMASLSAQACNACHGEIHDQWAKSGHATASNNRVYLAATAALGEPAECRNCHLPLENQRTTLHFGPGSTGPESENLSYDATLAEEGVTCAACHVRDGMIYGPRDLRESDAPHPVARADVLRSPEACAYCHQVSLRDAEEHPFIDTVGEWLRSPWGHAGIPCQQCHMARTSGIIGGSRYAAFSSHEFLAGRSPEAMRRAFTLEVDLRANSLERGQRLRATAKLMNTGAGHAVPTGDPSHQLEVRFEIEDPSGAAPRGVKPKSHWLGREVATTSPFQEKSDTRLAAASSRVFDYSAEIRRKLKPGRYTHKVQVNWWAVSPERAKKAGLEQAEVRIRVLEQKIPFRVY